MKQYEAVIETLEKLNGIATLGELYQEVFKIKDCEWKAKDPFANIRRIVQLNEEIYKIKPGLYALKSHKEDLESKGIYSEYEEKKETSRTAVFSHSYYQGVLLKLGNLKKYDTYVPPKDKNKNFIKKKLSNFSTLDAVPSFSYERFVRRSSNIDVIWFNERKMPHAFFEVEYTTDFHNSLIKFVDLQDFYAKMIIVADDKREGEFKEKFSSSAFDSVKDRVNFWNFDKLVKKYEYEIKLKNLSTEL